ncbi:EAL domain, c-di-GMP-specific phosphodiesterase class I (or its enzymatically inactive variant) [Lachnospiraceae bacterium]|nr:EAL domain, c-di-GMP-specific phosphodiesterase class I (or its enzymatically inactive variant) [Lachnospiraceae bacterium]
MKRTMVFRWFIAAFFCVFILMLCPKVDIEKVSGEESRDSLIVGVPDDRCPVFYVDGESGEVTGIGVDLMRAAAENAGFEAKFIIIEEKNLKEALDNEKYDVIMPFGSAIESALGRPTIVTDNLIQTPFTLVTTNKTTIPPMNELKVGMLKSLSGGAETVKELYPGVDISMYENMSDSVEALRSGKVDALLHNSYVWSYLLQKPAYSKLKVHPSAMFSMDFRVGTLDNADNRVLIARLNSGIERLTDTKRQAIVLDHTSRKLYKYDLSDYLYEYGVIITLGLLLCMMMAALVVMKARTTRLEQEEKMRRMIDHDLLTGALSLNGFKKRVEELLREYPDVPYIISYNNIKDFKFINESFGRNAGDDLLKFWVNRSLDLLSDMEAIGRLESDHFAVLRVMPGDDKLDRDNEHVFAPMRNFFTYRGKDIKVRIRSGVYVLTPEDYQQIDVERMLDCARIAEKKLREQKRDGFEIYNPTQWEKGKRIAEIVNHIPVALGSGEIRVWYQPQVDFDSGKIIGAEALCRWKHVQLGWISPKEFIPALEEAGHIYELDCFVWETVCRDIRRWNEAGVRRRISVNLSRCDILANGNVAEYFNELIKKYGIDADQLHIEITESAYVEEKELLAETTDKLRAFGFAVEMDDFGSGYSSLNMLKEVAVDRIKLDLKFQDDTGNPVMGNIIIKHIVQMIRELGMDVISEGVETGEKAFFLKEYGCTEMQGYYFYKPMPCEEFEKLK